MQLITKVISTARSIPKRIGNDLQSQRVEEKVLKRRGKVEEGGEKRHQNGPEKSVLI